MMGFKILAAICAYFLTVVHCQNVIYPKRLEARFTNTSCECGKPDLDSVSVRIVGGEISIPYAFPWLVAIFRDKKLFCGGAIINNRYILTAGHCIDEAELDEITIGVGRHNLGKVYEGKLLQSQKFIMHPDFDRVDFYDVNDIALIKTSEVIKYGEHVRPICLPRAGTVYGRERVQVAGWGSRKSGGAMNNILYKTTLKLINYEKCLRSKVGKYLIPSNICAYKRRTDACQGDSGGPLFYKRNRTFEIVGVVSWGIGCALRGFPGVYANVVHYLDWIYQNTQDSTYCQNTLPEI